MLYEILKKEDCEKCRFCCKFVESDKWEIPLIFAENKENIEKKTGLSLEKRGAEYVFPMEFRGEEPVSCPALSEKGCVLGELKPLDCKIWPFRVNRLGENLVITVSPLCEAVMKLPLSTLCAFLEKDGLCEFLFSEAEKRSGMVKEYLEGYPILKVRSSF